MVFGDSLADFAGQGLDDMFADNAGCGRRRQARGEQRPRARATRADWPKSIEDTLDSGQKATLAVVMLGPERPAGDQGGDDSVRTALRPLEGRLYRAGSTRSCAVFSERNIPVVWIGLPPMKNSRLSEDLVAMNEIYRESVQRNGGTYVDIWPGFVDDDNRYTAIGPDVDGQPARLRTNDGVFFTKAGSRKIAHFADVEIKRIIGDANRPARPSAVPAPVGPAATHRCHRGGACPLPPEPPAARSPCR